MSVCSQDSAKTIPKKKYYPFGTPSYLKPAYSTFAHLSVLDQPFALDLATAENVEAEIRDGTDELQKSKEKLQQLKLKKEERKKQKSNKDETDYEEEKIPDLEGMEPCNRPPCVKVLTLIEELLISNEDERFDIEDEYETSLVTLEEVDKEVQNVEGKLEGITELGNALESQLEQMTGKVKSLEKEKENLYSERADANNKIMILEIEKRKLARELELVKKEVADAMWKKKRQAQADRQEAGVSLETSSIADQSIISSTEDKILESTSLYETPYIRQAQSSTLDVCERKERVKNFSYYLKEKMIYEPNTFDKYSRKFYEKIAVSNESSRFGQDDLLLSFLDNREKNIKYSGAEAKMVSKMKKSKKPLSSEATANLEATKSLCSGGPPLFYYDPDGSRAMNSITSARAIVRVGQTLESNSRISLKSSNTVRLTPLDNSNSDFGNDIGITDWSQEFDGFDGKWLI